MTRIHSAQTPEAFCCDFPPYCHKICQWVFGLSSVLVREA